MIDFSAVTSICPLFQDPNLLSDDEVFLDSAASTVTSSTGLISPPPRAVVIRAQTTAVAQNVRGMLMDLGRIEVSCLPPQFNNILRRYTANFRPGKIGRTVLE